MIEELLPAGSASAEARGSGASGEALFPEEAALAASATAQRRAEFAAGRRCAHEALRGLGLPPAPIGRGARGEPLWPAGVVGSITHCDGYRACAVAREGKWLGLAIDAEPHAPISARLLDRLTRPAERRRHAELTASHPAVHWDRLLFSAKECAYKALSPGTTAAPPPAAVELEIDPAGAAFAARLPAGGVDLGARRVERLEGRWLVGAGLVLTAIAVPAQDRSDQVDRTGKPSETAASAQSAPASRSRSTV